MYVSRLSTYICVNNCLFDKFTPLNLHSLNRCRDTSSPLRWSICSYMYLCICSCVIFIATHMYIHIQQLSSSPGLLRRPPSFLSPVLGIHPSSIYFPAFVSSPNPVSKLFISHKFSSYAINSYIVTSKETFRQLFNSHCSK